LIAVTGGCRTALYRYVRKFTALAAFRKAGLKGDPAAKAFSGALREDHPCRIVDADMICRPVVR
jgi:hypothetical protein